MMLQHAKDQAAAWKATSIFLFVNNTTGKRSGFTGVSVSKGLRRLSRTSVAGS